MLTKLRRMIAAWREKNRQAAIDRALYKAGGGAEPPHMTMAGARFGPPAATHMPDVKDADDD